MLHARTHAVRAAALLITATAALSAPAQPARRTFELGERDFLLDGRPFVIRSGEMHAGRVPREYWRHRLQMVRAMGCNTVCAYLFWNQHEPRPGEFAFSGWADAAEYCCIAQEVGLWVILRPGPYACAEWDFGGFPAWLLKAGDIKVRTQDPRYVEPDRRYLRRVGQELAPLQATRGGPILMVQVENEYGSFGSDREYLGLLRDTLKETGFDVPLFTCDGPTQLKNDTRDDLFCVVNFGGDPARNFAALREIRPTGPLMCGEYYPGWFDSWGRPHHTGDTQKIIADLRYMLEQRASFSIYMVHGGTSFGFSSGANSPPFAPQTTSYDYDAPIDEAGRPTPKFHAIRELFAGHLLPGETLPDVPPPNSVITLPDIELTECAALFEQLGPGRRDERPQPMEQYDQAQGGILYRTVLPAGGAASLVVCEPHDYVQIYLEGRKVGVLDRRHRARSIALPARDADARLDLFVEAFGRVNYGPDIHDRKGITERVELREERGATELRNWEVFSLPFDGQHLGTLRFGRASGRCDGPAMYRASFDLANTGDTFLDLGTWHKGLVWVNGHNLGRYWNIGPHQTLYLPGCWLKAGRNEIVVLDSTGEAVRRSVRGLDAPILNDVRPDPLAPQKCRRPDQALRLENLIPVHAGRFDAGRDWQSARFTPVRGRFVCIEARDALQDEPFTTCAEVVLLDGSGAELPRAAARVVYDDNEDLTSNDGTAANIIDGDPKTFWHTEWQAARPGHPHHVVIDLGTARVIGGLRYLPRQDSPNGRIGEYRVFIRSEPFAGL